MVSEIIVGNGDGSGSHDGVNKAVFAVGKGTVYPDIASSKY